MSDLQKSFAKAHLSRLPPHPPPPPIFDEREEDEDELDDLRPTSPNDSSSSASSASSTGTVVPSPARNLFERPKSTATKSSSTTPLPWNDFFAQELYFENSEDSSTTHHAYLTPPSNNGPLILTHHGAGSSGLSFATFFSSLTTLLPTAGILSLDARGHGLTTTSPSTELDLTLPTLASDMHFVLTSTAKKMSWSTLPPILLIGHSLGGAVVTELAVINPPPTLMGLIVLDVVEGSAIDALSSMDAYLATRPSSFPSISSAIDWHTRSRTIRNTTSARVSVPALLTESTSQPTKFLWRTSLSLTRPFWSSWFTSLSTKFLTPPSSVAKLLILAGTDRLDKPLTIAQMQGKYQLVVFPEAGHFVHEDVPEKVAQRVAEFYKRNESMVGGGAAGGGGRGGLVLPPKVDELIRMGKVKGKIVEDSNKETGK